MCVSQSHGQLLRWLGVRVLVTSGFYDLNGEAILLLPGSRATWSLAL